MFSWTKRESTANNVDHLQSYLRDYYKIEIRTDTDEVIKVGDYVRLKYHPFLTNSHAGLVANPCAQDHEYCAYVAGSIDTKAEDKHNELGRLYDVRIAVVHDGYVKIKLADSRLLYKISDTHICPTLKEFVLDSFISEISPGMLVRFRAHVDITDYKPRSADTSAFKIPLIALHVSGSTAILAGITTNSCIVQRITVPLGFVRPFEK
jgi:hypothetical protein